jgi:hypothetical protein
MDKRKILEAYLGEYFCKPISDATIRDKIVGDIRDPKLFTFCYQVDGLMQLRQVVQTAVLGYGKNITYQVCDSYKDVIERYIRGLNRDAESDDSNVLGTLSEPVFLVIYKPKVTFTNKQMIPLCVSVAETRALLAKKTLFIVFQPVAGLTDKYPYTVLRPGGVTAAPPQSSNPSPQPSDTAEANPYYDGL